jgi:2-dehydro-3-deoxyphosphogluconate aldolase/(4S)-4-hydroxy-2-oxoglutarate aldolase
MSKFSKQEVLAKLDALPAIPLFYHADVTFATQILDASYQAGMRAFEFTNRGPEALTVFKALVEHAAVHCPDLALGIGTIFTPEQAEHFLDAGADFLIQPVITPAVGEVCQQRGVAWLPGALTVNEIYHAQVLGADIVKIFPANALGSGFIKSVMGPLPAAKLMVTGGVEPNEANLREWFGAGAQYVGLGSQLFKNADQLGVEALSRQIAEVVEIVKKITGK